MKTSIASATKVANLYGVSEKAIRDIWTGRTWAAETWHLDTSRVLKVKKQGRSVGHRDTKSRKPRQSSKTAIDATVVYEDGSASDKSIVDGRSAPQESRHKSLDEQLSDWGRFWNNDKRSDPFASDWLNRRPK